MNGKLNNPSWCCDRIIELIEEYKRKAKETYGTETYVIYDQIIEDLENILYN